MQRFLGCKAVLLYGLIAGSLIACDAPANSKSYVIKSGKQCFRVINQPERWMDSKTIKRFPHKASFYDLRLNDDDPATKFTYLITAAQPFKSREEAYKFAYDGWQRGISLKALPECELIEVTENVYSVKGKMANCSRWYRDPASHYFVNINSDKPVHVRCGQSPQCSSGSLFVSGKWTLRTDVLLGVIPPEKWGEVFNNLAEHFEGSLKHKWWC